MKIKKHHNIVLYLSSGLHTSELTREYFRQTGYDFEEVNIDKDIDLANDIFNRVGKKESPIVEIDGRVVSGYRPEMYEIILNDNTSGGGGDVSE